MLERREHKLVAARDKLAVPNFEGVLEKTFYEELNNTSYIFVDGENFNRENAQLVVSEYVMIGLPHSRDKPLLAIWRSGEGRFPRHATAVYGKVLKVLPQM